MLREPLTTHPLERALLESGNILPPDIIFRRLANFRGINSRSQVLVLLTWLGKHRAGELRGCGWRFVYSALSLE